MYGDMGAHLMNGPPTTIAIASTIIIIIADVVILHQTTATPRRTTHPRALSVINCGYDNLGKTGSAGAVVASRHSENFAV